MKGSCPFCVSLLRILLAKRKGRIITVASIAGKMWVLRRVAYAASKRGLPGLTWICPRKRPRVVGLRLDGGEAANCHESLREIPDSPEEASRQAGARCDDTSSGRAPV